MLRLNSTPKDLKINLEASKNKLDEDMGIKKGTPEDGLNERRNWYDSKGRRYLPFDRDTKDTVKESKRNYIPAHHSLKTESNVRRAEETLNDRKKTFSNMVAKRKEVTIDDQAWVNND